MFHLLAGVFAGAAVFMSGLLGGHGSTTPSMMHDHDMASSTERGGWMKGDQGHMGSTTSDGKPPMLSGIAGKVTAVNGSSLTVVGRDAFKSATTTYTVDASNAKVMKDGVQNATVANVAVGDTILVSGPISDTTVTAKIILDGKLANHPALEHVLQNAKGRVATSTLMSGDAHNGMSTTTKSHGDMHMMGSTTMTHGDAMGHGMDGGKHMATSTPGHTLLPEVKHEMHGELNGSAQM